MRMMGCLAAMSVCNDVGFIRKNHPGINSSNWLKRTEVWIAYREGVDEFTYGCCHWSA